MALPASGPISMSMVNTELGLSATAVITLNDAAVRTLFNKSSGAIALSDGYGKSAVVDTMPMIDPGGTYSNTTDRTIGAEVNLTGASLNDYVGPIFNVGNFGVGGGNTEGVWQFHTGQVFDVGYPANIYCPNPHDQVYGSYTSFGNDTAVFSNGDSSFQTLGFLTVQLRQGSVNGHGVEGYWRLKVTNSIGTRYSYWIHVIKHWGEYSYDCGCTCGCTCGCDENNENCTGCCDGCCDTCYGYSYQSSAQTDWCA
jgi:hypothetical protein